MAEQSESRSEPASEEDNQRPDRPATTVVGIGASAGGLTALRTFFSHVPEDSGLAFVVVVHLSPEHKSHLADLLQPHVKMPVQQVSETVALEPDHVYVIPPGANLSAIDTHLRLSQLEKKRRERAPVDHFLRTLAVTHDGHAVAVILTGTGSDGALGVKEIKEKGGLTVVQDPVEAEYDGMPQSAISTGLVDLVLPLSRIPDAILRFARTQPKIEVPDDGKEVQDPDRQLLHKILSQIRARTGRDFSRYKRSTIVRRIHRRMQLRQTELLPEYLDLLRAEAEEVRALADDLLITVTNFFRDPQVFQELEAEVIPKLFREKGASDSIRVWSVGCASGEEAYTLAVLLLEEAARHDSPPHLQVFASDLHERSLERGREGLYPGDIETDVSAERLRRFFQNEDGAYRVRKEVRELVVFAPHNLLADPPFSKMDLIACRNVLIYLQREVQRDVLELFHYALRPEGFLVLGTSETVEGSELFRVENKRLCVYRKRNVPAAELRLPVFPLLPQRGQPPLDPHEPRPEPIPYGALHQHAVEMYAPPSMLVTPDHRVVHLSANAGRYLVHPGGELTSHVFRLIREELRIELRSGLHAATEQNRVARVGPIEVSFDGGPRSVFMDLRPLTEKGHEGFALVIFDERETAEAAPAQPDDTQAETDAHATGVERELDVTKQRLHAIIEEYETGQEEMRASQEELQSSNEEMRSTLEELETSKEELQSMNEELQTVNQENRHKVEELAQLSSDLQNLLASTDIPTLFLNRELRILRFTPQAAEIFNVRPADRGRPISDLTHRLRYPELRSDSESVLRRLIPIEREVSDDRGNWYLTRVRPYRSADDRIDGVVITFVDITARLRAEEALRQSEERYRALLEASAQIVWTTDAQGQVVEDSPSWRAFTGQTLEERLGDGWINVVHPDDRQLASETWRRSVEIHRPLDIQFRLWHGMSKSWRLTHVRAVPLRRAAGQVVGWVGMNVDVTERRQAEEALRQLNETLEQRIQQRTLELEKVNLALSREVDQRKRSEERLKEIRDLLSIATGASQLGWGSWDFRTGAAEWDERGRQIIGLSPEEAKSAESWLARIHPEDRARVQEEVERSIVERRPYNIEYRVEQPDGEIRHIHGTGAFTVAAHRAPLRASGFVRDITDRKHAEETRAELLRQLASAEEDERRRISRELHDQMGQLVTALTLELRALTGATDDAATGERLRKLEKMADAIAEEIHGLALELRPPALDNLGLELALKSHLEDWAERHGMDCDFHSSGMEGVRLPPEIEIALFRAAQEGLTNVLKHARASRVSLVLKRARGSVSLILEDDGTGFEVETMLQPSKELARIGLRGMKERIELLSGTLQIESTPGDGTTLFARVPDPTAQTSSHQTRVPA